MNYDLMLGGVSQPLMPRTQQDRSLLAAALIGARLLQFCNCGDIGWMAVHVDHSRPVPGSMQRQLQEVLGGNQISVGRQHEIDGVAGRVNRPIQVYPISGDPNVGLVHPPRSIRMPPFAPKFADSK